MPLYTPDHFAAPDGPPARALIDTHPFATLITALDGVEPQITYLPLLLDGNDLLGHMAKPNPHWQRFAQGRTVALFHGPHAFVSSRWYQNPADNVPTWNYAVVHAHGRPELLDTSGAHAVLARVTARFEQGPATTAPDKAERLLNGIVAFRMPIARLEVKFKMSQNKSAADRAGVAAGLRATGRPEDRAVADWMQAHAGG